MTAIIIIILGIALLDTLIGNWWFPSKEGIVKGFDGRYRFYKYNRIMFIPFKMWENTVSHRGICLMCDFAGYRNAYIYEGIENAKRCLTKNRKGRKDISYEEVYTTGKTQEDYSYLLEDLTDQEEIRVAESIIKRLNGTLN